MKFIKTLLKYILTFPQASIHKLKGLDIRYSDLVTFFRYFPYGKINTDQTVTIKYRGNSVRFFFETLGPMAAGEFALKDYDRLPVEGRVVIDIGAAYGDTATMFALRGARKVIGYELNKRHFLIAKRNIELNQIENQVDLHYCGISAEKIRNSDEILGALIPARDRVHVDEADFCTLNDIVQINELSYDAVLKIDVDGYEYEILSSAEKKTLNRFSHIVMEYHFGVQGLVSILESAGFMTEVKPITKTIALNHPESFRNMEIGMIYAERVRIV